jgi:AcrR family transcriptional regulator
MTSLDTFLLDDEDAPSKREILRCALRLFVRDGLCETSIREIGKAAGYTNPALYKFFPSKEALALHLFERCYTHVFATIERSQAQDQPLKTRVGTLVGAFTSLVDDSLDAVLYVDENLRTFWPRLPRAARRQSVLQVLGGLVEAGRREAAILPACDTDLAVAMLVGTMSQIARMAYFDEIARPLASRSAHLRTLFLSALKGRSSL